MENSHNIQFSSINDSTHVPGKPQDGKTAKMLAEAQRASRMPVIDPVSFIEPFPDLADLLKKGRRA